MKKFTAFLKSFDSANRYIFLILLAGLFFRIYNFRELFMYTHDHDLAGWFIKDIVVNGHLRLIGQETSTAGIYIGPIFYYLLIPFYFIFRMDPIGGVFLVTILGMLTIWSIYWVLSRIFERKTGLVASFIYSISFYGVFNDREIVPTMPVILWSVWYFYCLNLFLRKEYKKALLILGILVGLIWHLNMALIIVLPLALVAYILSRGKAKLSDIVGFLIPSVLLDLPLLLFELRHNFLQTNAFIASLTTDQHDVVRGYDKLVRVIHLLSKDFSAVLWGSYFDLKFEWVTLAFLVIFACLVYKKYINSKLGILMGLWILTYIAFFSLYSKIVSEYYLNGTIFIFITVISLGLSRLLSSSRQRTFAEAFLLLFAIVNIDRFMTLPVNKSGYVEKNQIISEIKSDAEKHGYPCVSISYITDPGYNLGYRYITWFRKLKLKPISREVPVYTIVNPLKPVFKTGKDFGSIGLIYPDYKSYDRETVNKSCEGEDFNVTDSMLGYN